MGILSTDAIRLRHAFRLEATAAILDHHRVAAFGPPCRPVDVWLVQALIWRAQQERRKCAAAARQEDVRRQFDAVAHGRLQVVQDADLVRGARPFDAHYASDYSNAA